VPIEYGFSHQCYSDIYSKLFNGMCISKSMDLSSLEQKLEKVLRDLDEIKEVKNQRLSGIRSGRIDM
jgi:hypothetical protein